MPICEVLAIGTELVSGNTLNTNAHYLSSELSRLNFEVSHHTSCRDLEEDILDALQLAWGRSRLIFVVGGLGPTPDDITRDVIAKFFNCGLEFDRKQYGRIVRYFREKGKKTPLITKREASLPDVAEPLLNRFGLALGFYVWLEGRLLIALPGVPKELVGMFETSVKKLIQRKFKDRDRVHLVEARILGLYETEIMQRLGSGFFKGREFVFGIYPDVGEVLIRIKTKDRALARLLRHEVQRKLGASIYSFDSVTITEAIGRALLKRSQTLAVAESCTGGLLAKRLTETPGASRYFKGGVIAYSNDIKKSVLGVPAALMVQNGAVSGPVARHMAEGVRACFRSSLGISITGIAGPGGGSAAKPVGLVWIALSDIRRSRVFKYRFSGGRADVRLHAAQKALQLLWEHLQAKSA